MITSERHDRARRLTLGSIALLAVAAVAMWLAALVVTSGEAASHARLHAFSALVMLGIAGIIAARWGRRGVIALGPAVGLALFAVAQLVEGLGAMGYEPDNSTRRSALADLHDVGLALTGPAIAALVVGIATTAGIVVGRRTARRWAGVAVGLAILVPGLLLIKVTMGGI